MNPPATPSSAEKNALILLYKTGQFLALENQSQQLIERFPDAGIIWKLLAASLGKQGKDALPALLKTAEFLPDDAETQNNLGIIFEDRGQHESALASYNHALRLKPDFAEAHYNLGNTFIELGRIDEAISSYRNALKYQPEHAVIHSNLGAALQDLGRHDEAVLSYRRVLELMPDYNDTRSNLLFAMNSSSSFSVGACLEEAGRYGTAVAKKVRGKFNFWQCDPQPPKLRVGFVSGDLRKHPVGYFLENLITHLDLAHVELIAYSTIDHADELTLRIQPYFSKWRVIFGMNNQAAAQQIHLDGVHILFDLAGHTAKNRLPVFAWKPAPVQCTWLGYFASTGVAEMDYLLADETSIPQPHQVNFTEAIWYLPDTKQCLTQPNVDMPCSPPPALANKQITFACFQRLTKIEDAVLKLWQKILARLPDARLHLACKELDDEQAKSHMMLRLQNSGFNSTQIVMSGAIDSWQGYMARYNEIDIMLDTSPYTGTTTTCEALWMGVPTITLAGDSFLSRHGASVVSAASLPDWIARDEDDYVAKAIAFAGDLPKLAALRAGLREQVRVSPLFDAPRFARNFEAALWGMWQNWRMQQGINK